jgi:hypothetical protein
VHGKKRNRLTTEAQRHGGKKQKKKKKRKKKQKLEGDYMDYWITWMETYMSFFLIHLIP